MPIAGQRLWDFDADETATNRYEILAVKPISWGDWGLVLTGQFQAVQNDDNEPIDVLRLGGFRRLSAFSEDSLTTNRYLLGGVEVYRRLTSAEGITNFPVYVGLTGEVADVELDIFESGLGSTLFSVGTYVGTLTPIGPVFFGGGIGDGGEGALFFSLGRSF